MFSEKNVQKVTGEDLKTDQNYSDRLFLFDACESVFKASIPELRSSGFRFLLLVFTVFSSQTWRPVERAAGSLKAARGHVEFLNLDALESISREFKTLRSSRVFFHRPFKGQQTERATCRFRRLKSLFSSPGLNVVIEECLSLYFTEPKCEFSLVMKVLGWF